MKFYADSSNIDEITSLKEHEYKIGLLDCIRTSF